MPWFTLKTRLVIAASAALGLGACGRGNEAPPATIAPDEEAAADEVEESGDDALAEPSEDPAPQIGRAHV